MSETVMIPQWARAGAQANMAANQAAAAVGLPPVTGIGAEQLDPYMLYLLSQVVPNMPQAIPGGGWQPQAPQGFNFPVVAQQAPNAGAQPYDWRSAMQQQAQGFGGGAPVQSFSNMLGGMQRPQQPWNPNFSQMFQPQKGGV